MTPLIQALLRSLHRIEVTECALAAGRFPAARHGAEWIAIEESPVSADDILAILVGLGGDRHVERLADTPIQWQFRSRGLGVVAVTATRRGEDVRARLVVSQREAAAPAPGARKKTEPPPPKRSIVPAPPPVATPPFSLSQATAEMPITTVLEPEAPRPKRSPSTSKQSAIMMDRDADKGLYAKKRPAAVAASSALADLINAARAASASDLHIVSERPALFRVAGELTPRGDNIEAARAEALLLPIVPARLRDELDTAGSCDFAMDDPAIGRARVNVSRQRTGYKGTFRLIAAEIPTLVSLGLPEEVARATRHHQGLILVTGPTGHGKTTTLAAIVDHVNRESTHHVITVEDPVEYVHPRKRAMMSQREVGTHTKSFGRALKGALREDPDVIVVGELRDLETVEMAIAASETGHLVIGTMNTPSAAKTIDRLIDMFPPGDQGQVRRTMAGGLKLIIGQRLVPSVDRKRVHAAVELLTGTVALWNLIREEKTFQIPSLQQRGRSLGIIRLDDSLAGLVKAGKITQEEGEKFAESPETYLSAVRGPAPPPEPPKPGLLGNVFGRKS